MQVPLKKSLHGSRLVFPDGLLPLKLLFLDATSTSLCWWLRGWSGFWCQLCTLIPVVPETALVSSRTLSFYFPLIIAFSLSSFNTTLIPEIRNHRPCFNPLISGVEVSQSEFLIYASLHHRFQFLIIGIRYLLMNFFVIQFQYGFVQTHVFSICTSFQRFHQMGFASSIIEFRPISNRISSFRRTTVNKSA